MTGVIAGRYPLHYQADGESAIVDWSSGECKMTREVIPLRASYWLGAILDGILVVPMLFPQIGGAMLGIDHFGPGNDYRYAMMVGASLMFGWTILLIWADRRPAERKGVLLLTVPVIIGLMLANLFAVSVGLIRFERMIPSWLMETVVLILFCCSYFASPKKTDRVG
jgi:hypothetical protein